MNEYLQKEWADDRLPADVTDAMMPRPLWRCLAGLGHPDYRTTTNSRLAGHNCKKCADLKQKGRPAWPPERVYAALLARIHKQPNGCWIYTGAKGRGGYGVMSVNGGQERAHRYMYQHVHGKSQAIYWFVIAVTIHRV